MFSLFFFIRFQPLEAITCGFLLLVCEKQNVLLIFNLFSSLLTLKRFSCGFLLVVCEEDVFLFLLSVACGFLLLVCGEARRFTCIICFHRF